MKYAEGKGVQTDYPTALKWFQEAATEILSNLVDEGRGAAGAS